MEEVKNSITQKLKSNTLWLIIILSVSLLVGVLSYFFFSGKLKFEKDTDQDLENETLVVEDVEYINENFGIKFKYPGNWVVMDVIEEGDMALTLRIGEKEDASEYIFLYEIKPSEVNKCIYSEADLTESQEPTYEVYLDNYVDISDEYRRSYTIYGAVKGYKVCKKDSNGIYTDSLPGYITYWNVNNTEDGVEDMLDILDNIVLSFEYTQDIDNE